MESRIKKAAAIRLLTESHYRLPLDDLSKALTLKHGLEVPSDLLAPGRLSSILSTDSCFVVSDDTGNVLVDAADLMAAGKDCLRAQIDRAWDAVASPLSWARNQLAWYIVSRQHIDMRISDLFLTPVDDAESFLAAAWTSRMDLRDHSDHPYHSLAQLLGGETRLELTPDCTAIRLNFNRLLQHQPQPQPQQQQGSHQQPAAPPVPPPPLPQQLLQNHHHQQQQQQQQVDEAGYEHGNGPEAADWGQGGIDGLAGEVQDVAAATAALQRASLSQRSGGNGPHSQTVPAQHSGANGHHGQTKGRGAEAAAGDDFFDDEEEDYGDVGEEDQDEDAEGRYPSGRGGAAAAAGAGAGGAAGPRNPPLPLRPDLLRQYVRAVFCSSGSSADQLMAVVAMALVDAGRSQGQASQRGPDAHRFSLPLGRLVAHVRESVPHLLPAGAGAGSAHGGGGWHVGALIQRLRERHSRGCFRVVVPEAGGAGEEGEEAVAVLDFEALRERVVEALAAAAAAVFSGGRAVDEIRRAAAAQLASRTRGFAGRVHCVRLSTLARELSERLPPELFDPTRLSGFERMVGAENSNNVMHVFRKALPGGLAGLGHHPQQGGEVGTFVTLNLGKLLAAAGIREVESASQARSARGEVRGERRVEGRGGGEGVRGGGAVRVGRGGPETASAAAAAAASRAAAFAAVATRDSHFAPPPPPSQPHHHSAAAAPGGFISSSNGLPPPPSDAALRQAVEVLFPVMDGGRGGSGSEHPTAVAAAARRTAALSLVKALHSQQGGFLPLSRLSDIVLATVPAAPDLEHLLAADPDLFEIQATWYGGPRSVRLRASAVIARAAATNTSAAAATSSSSDTLPRRAHLPNCPYYMRTGACGYGAACKYNHPPLTTSRQSGHVAVEPPAPAPAAAAPSAAAPYRQQPQAPPAQPQPQTPPHSQQQLGHASLPPPPAAPAAAAASAPYEGGGAAAARLSPASLEVKVITTACTSDHVDMLQHCFAAPQVAVACKVSAPHPHSHAYHPGHPRPAGEARAVVLVQLYAPAVAAASGGAAAPGGAGSTTGGGSGSAAAAAAAAAGAGGGASGAGGGAPPRWPATVYLVDPVAGEDRGGLLLPSLSPFLMDPQVPKVIYCCSEVARYMPRISPLHDISVLHTLVARAPAVVMGPSAGEPPSPTVLVPPLATMLQQQGVVTAAGAAAMAVAPSNSPLWSSRPLAPEMRQQAVLEVVHLAALWTGLMARLGLVPQQLSQATADRLFQEQAAHSAAQGTTAGSGAAGGVPVRPTGRAAPVATGGMVAVASGGPTLGSGGSGGVQQRGLVYVHRSAW